MMNANYEKTDEEDQFEVPPYNPPPYETNGLTADYPPYPTAAAATVGVTQQQWSALPPAYSTPDNRPLQGYGRSPALPSAPGSLNANPTYNHPVSQYGVGGASPYPGYGYNMAGGQQQQVVVVQQPGHHVMRVGPLEDPPDDYMCYSIFVTLCCCWLIGIFAIARSSECRAAIAAGDRVTAEFKSREARSKAHMALVFGIISLVVCGAIIGVYYGLAFSRYQ